MIFEGDDDIREFLRVHHGFGECVLTDVRWEHHGTVITLVLNYIWDEEGNVRGNLDEPDFVSLRLFNVQEFHLRNALSEYLSLHPAELGWAISEVADVQLVEESELLVPYEKLPIPLHHIRFIWEGDRRIDIIFSTMEVVKS
jgi:hypothetical protein